MNSSSRTHGVAATLAVFALTAMIPLCGTGAAYASDAPPSAGGVLLSPAKFSQTVHPGAVNIPVTLRNTSGSAQSITLSAAPLAHTLTGVAYPGTQPTGIAPLLTFNPPTLLLAAGQAETVNATGTIAAHAGGLYATLIADVTPAASAAVGSNVTSRVRLVSIIELAADTGTSAQIHIGTITAAKGARANAMRFNTIVHNTGNVAVTPAGHAIIMSGDRQLADLPLAAAVIIPGNARRMTAAWSAAPAGLAGVRVHVILTNPAANAWSTITFASGQPEQSTAVITGLTYNQSSGNVLLTVTNTGTVPVNGHVTLSATSLTAPAVSSSLPVTALAPGQRHDLSAAMRLRAGKYLLTATVRSGNGVLDVATANVIVTGSPASGDNWIWFYALAGLAVAAATFLIWRRRRPTDPPRNTGSVTRRPAGSLRG